MARAGPGREPPLPTFTATPRCLNCRPEGPGAPEGQAPLKREKMRPARTVSAPAPSPCTQGRPPVGSGGPAASTWLKLTCPPEGHPAAVITALVLPASAGPQARPADSVRPPRHILGELTRWLSGVCPPQALLENCPPWRARRALEEENSVCGLYSLVRPQGRSRSHDDHVCPLSCPNHKLRPFLSPSVQLHPVRLSLKSTPAPRVSQSPKRFFPLNKSFSC